MAGIESLSEKLQQRLDEAAAEREVVGASLAVRQAGTTVEAATGVTNVRTGLRVTPDTIFQIGSITKAYTATLVMQLVDEGLVDLDEPVATYLPFTTDDAEAAATVTVRHLLSHTSGVDGDVFDDFGRGDDCVARYVEGMGGLAHTHQLGEMFSYCNSGYVLLGRLIEELRGSTWDSALRQHVLEPLGAGDTVTLPEEAILRPVAVGHLPTGPDKAPQVAPVWHLPRALGPAGTISAPAREVLAFARLHLDDGRTSDGRQLLSPAGVKAMRQLEIEMPDPYTLGDAWGLGLILFRRDAPVVFGHDGTTIGQNAYLRVIPDADLSVVLLTNGGGAAGLFDDVVRPLVRDLGGAELQAPARPPSAPLAFDPAPFLGSFERSGVRVEITLDPEGLVQVQARTTGPLAGTLPDEPAKRLVGLDETTLITAEADPRSGRHITYKFLAPSAAGYGYVHYGVRATPRVPA